MSRRRLLAGGISLAGTALLGPAWAWFVEPRWVDHSVQTVPVEGLTSPVRIVHITDLHASEAVPLAYLRRVADLISADPPDAVVVTGDLVTEDPLWIEGVARVLGEIRSRAGTFAILGNHDYWTDGPRLSRALDRFGVHHLRNANTHIDSLRLVGIDDHWTGNDDLERAIAGVGADEATLLMMHSPDLIYPAADGGIPLAVCGHTHGGQIRLPGMGALVVPSAYGFEQGWYEVDGTRMYVNRGVGTLSVKARLLCRPEVAELRLVPA